MNHEEYWLKRAEQIEESIFNDTLKMTKEINRIYGEFITETEKAINDFILKYANENDTLSFAELENTLLTPVDMIDYRQKISALTEIYKTTQDENVMMEMRTLRERQKISLLQSLIDELKARRGRLSIEEAKLVETHLASAYEYAFVQTAYEVSVASGVTRMFTMPSEEALKQIIKYPASGINFSDAIWRNNDKFIETLKNELIRGVVQGKSTKEMSKSLKPFLRDSSNKKKADYLTERILRTESSSISNSARVDVFKQEGTKGVWIRATLHKNICKSCEKHDSKFVPVDEIVKNVTIPPFHPNCRCKVLNDAKRLLKDRVDMTDEGIIYGTNSLGNKVIADRRMIDRRMTAEEFRKVYIDKTMTYEEWESNQ